MTVHRLHRLLLAALLALSPPLTQGADAGLLEAARAGDPASVQAALEAGASPDASDASGATALHWAVYRGDSAAVEALLAAGADPDARNRYDAPPMHLAAQNGEVAVVTALLAAGADVESPNRHGQTALMIAARGGHDELVRLLLAGGADVNAREQWRGQTALMWAAAQLQADTVALLLEHGAEPNARAAVNRWHAQVSSETRAQYRPLGGLTPLLYAAREGCVRCVQALVGSGADPDLGDPRGVTPLIIALDNFHFETAMALIRLGADVNRWDRWGRSPLYVAVDMNTLPRGGRPDRPTEDRLGALDVAEVLLERGANPDMQLKARAPYRDVDDDRGTDLSLTVGATALLRAAKAFDTDAIDLLLMHGADVDLANVQGITPLLAAAGQGSLTIDTRGRYDTSDVEQRAIAALERLLAAGADINAVMHDPRRHARLEAAMQPKQGQTAVHGAAFWGWNDVLVFLAERGADLHARDANDRTVLDAALGRAGGNGRFGSEVNVHEDTAELVRGLMAGTGAAAPDDPEGAPESVARE